MSELIATPLSLAEVLEKEKKIEIEKGLAIHKAFDSGDVNEIYRAQSYLKQIEQRQIEASKSILIDPMEMTSSFGYKDKPFQISYDVLRAMSRTHIVKAIIETRKEQVQNFCTPQSNKYQTGFIITKKQKYTELGRDIKLTTQDKKKIEWLIDFIMGCGEESDFWNADTFENFVAKLVTDMLTLDQGTFEIKRNMKGDPIAFLATDGATYRIADTYLDTELTTRYPEKVVKGYLPSYVQLYQNKIIAEFYPWELCFGVMNPQTDIRINGYGKSPLEDMISTVTSILNADAYNANFFKVGSSPKGILRVFGNLNQNTIEDFKQQWQTQVSGVMNSHKMPVVNAEKMEFVNTNVPNKDMEFSQFQEFLIKITCAQFKIDPSEVGFPMSGNASGESGLGGNNQEEKVKYSKDKGLKPLLKKIEYWINKYIVSQKDPDFVFRFVGLDEDMANPKEDLEQDVELVSSIQTLNEIRIKRNLKPIDGGDIPMNPVYLQALQMEQQAQMQKQQMGMQQQQMDSQKAQQGQDEQAQEQEDNPFGGNGNDDSDQKEDPFMKSLAAELEVILCK
jgi:hypothetical protein